MLVDRKDLARTSSTPGKTVSINFFLINAKWHLVDLPGYGYAKRSKTLRVQWETVLIEYLKERENLQCIFVLIDCRVPPQNSDISFINMLGEMGVPFILVFTKLDKLKAIDSAKNIEKFKETLLLDWAALPQCFETSSEKVIGRKELLDFINRPEYQRTNLNLFQRYTWQKTEFSYFTFSLINLNLLNTNYEQYLV